jgi:hypothetical protein
MTATGPRPPRSRAARSVDPRHAAGARAEALAAAYLEARGVAVLERNFRCRTGEIDLVARDGDTLVFVEVRLRRRSDYGGAAASISPPPRTTSPATCGRRPAGSTRCCSMRSIRRASSGCATPSARRVDGARPIPRPGGSLRGACYNRPTFPTAAALAAAPPATPWTISTASASISTTARR